MFYNNKTFPDNAEKATIKLGDFEKYESFFLKSASLKYKILKF